MIQCFPLSLTVGSSNLSACISYLASSGAFISAERMRKFICRKHKEFIPGEYKGEIKDETLERKIL